jgi:hypothetical protein
VNTGPETIRVYSDAGMLRNAQDYALVYGAALARAKELAASEPLSIDLLYRAAQPFKVHRGATFVEFVGYVEREIGLEVAS